MGKRIAYGALAILTIVTLFSVDAAIARWVAGVDEPGLSTPRSPIFNEAIDNLLVHGNVLPVLLAIVVLFGSLELVQLLEARGARPNRPFTAMMSVAVFLSPWFSAAGWLGTDVASVEGLYWPLVLIGATVLGSGVIQVLRGRTEGSLADLGATCLTVLYIGFLASFALQLRSGADSPGEQGVWLLLITLLVTKSSDIGAYFAGSAFGRHKLAPRVSPNKSVEGAIGGILGSAAVAVLVTVLPALAAKLDLPLGVRMAIDQMTLGFGQTREANPTPLVRAIVFGMAMSIVGQAGDLVESCFKRDAGAKDSGRILPQFGGILDLIDSPVFSVPVAWFLLIHVWSVI